MFSKRIRSLENMVWEVVHLLGAKIKYFMVTLREKDILGASLDARDLSELKVPELKHWLACGGVPQKGKKAHLAARFVEPIPFHVHIKKDLKLLCLLVL